MDINKLKGMLDLVENSSFKKVTITSNNEFTIEMEKFDSQSHSVNVEKPSKYISSSSGMYIIKSPMVGIFHLNTPNQKNSLIEVGKTICSGQSLCYIEAMKLFNSIDSDIDGTIEEIFVNEGDMVEFDTPLIKIKKA